MKFFWSATIILGVGFGVYLAAADEEPSKSIKTAGFVDVHMHFNTRPVRGRGDSFDEGPGLQAPDFDSVVLELLEKMDSLGLEKAVIMPPPSVSSQKRPYPRKKILSAIKKYPNRLYLAAGGDTLNPMIMDTKPLEVTPEIKKEFRQKALKIVKDGAVAFGEMAALHFSFSGRHPIEEALPDHPLFLLLADIAAEYEMPIDLHTEAVLEEQATPAELLERSSNNPERIKPTIPGLERLLAHNPKAKIVWQHVGWDNTGHMTPELVRRLLKAHPNLFCAFKFVQRRYETFQAGEGIFDDEMRLRESWLNLIKEFPDRFMIGADEFVRVPGPGRRAGPPSFQDTWALINQLPDGLKNKVGRENAMRVYSFKN